MHLHRTAGRGRAGSLILGALVAAAWLRAAAAVAALDGAPRLGLTPVGGDATWFELTLNAGESRRLEVEAANFGDRELLARTYAAGVYSLVNGGFGATLFGEEAAGTVGWLAYPTQQLDLGPGDAVVVPFEVAVPAGTPPGEYIAALAIENVEPIRGSGSVALDQVNRSAIAVAIDVPGPRRPAVSIGAVGHGTVADRSVVTFEVANPGNVHLKPAGEFRLMDAGGLEVSAGVLAMDSVYAGTETLLEATLAGLLPAGDYCAELALTDAATGAGDATACLPFSVLAPAAEPEGSGRRSGAMPLWLPSTEAPLVAAPILAVALLGVALVGRAIVLARRRRNS